MLSCLLFAFIGYWLNAPVWYYFVIGIKAFFVLANFGLSSYKAGKKNES